MGLVYACRHRELPGHMVAVKVLFPEVAQDRVAAARFRNEIFASYEVSHPNIVRAFEYIRDGDITAYSMEYVSGGALADRLEKHKEPLAIGEVVGLLSQMCAGVQAIHDAGIVHRDLKPENILLTREGQVKIADFGIARTTHGPKLTEHGGVVGTINYVSPEYLLNSQVDWRSDIYALGILAYEMVTGQSPFAADSVYATMTKRLKTDPPKPSTLRADCPPALDDIILRAMARDPAERYQSAADMFLDLQRLIENGVTVSSGTLLQVKRAAGKEYHGPRVNEAEEGRRAPPEPAKRSGYISSHPSGNESQQPYIPSGAILKPGPRPGPSVVSSGNRPPSAPLRKPEKAATNRPPPSAPMDAPRDATVLGGPINDLTMAVPRDLRASGKVIVAKPGIKNDRLKELSSMVDQGQGPAWVDLMIILIAVSIGLGLGLLVLRFFFPEVNPLAAIFGERALVAAWEVVTGNLV